MLILSRKIDEKIKIGDNITITLIDVHGDQVKIGVEAPKNVKVFRQEVFDAIQNENKAAAVENKAGSEEKSAIAAVSALSKLLGK
ncbi:MAG: carbon storage regulator CsrA [Treponema sp.]|nr:carbon storage regulator CsrA [Treponema sp.]